MLNTFNGPIGCGPVRISWTGVDFRSVPKIADVPKASSTTTEPCFFCTANAASGFALIDNVADCGQAGSDL